MCHMIDLKILKSTLFLKKRLEDKFADFLLDNR